MRANEQRELLRVTLRSIGDAVITTDIEGRVTYLNAVAESLTGWTQREARGPAARRGVPDRQRGHAPAGRKPGRRRRFAKGSSSAWRITRVLIRKDGGELPDRRQRRADQGRARPGLRMRADLPRRHRAAAHGAGQGQPASDGPPARVDRRILGRRHHQQVAGRHHSELERRRRTALRLHRRSRRWAATSRSSFPPDRIAEEDRIIASLKAGQRIEHFETERLRSDGQRILVSLTISPDQGRRRQRRRGSKIVRDITDRKRAEAEREKFVTLIENSTDFIGMCDLDGVPFFVNRAGLEMVGLDDIERRAACPWRRSSSRKISRGSWRSSFRRSWKTGHGEIEVRFRHFKTGEARWMAYKVLTLPDAAGRPVAFATVART